MDDEPIDSIYRDEVVAVSLTEFVVRSQTYPISGITSVSTVRRPANRIWATIMAIGGVLILVLGLSSALVAPIVAGAIVGVLGVLWYRVIADQYGVVLTTKSGQTEALTSGDEQWIASVAGAINKALKGSG